MRLTSFLIVPAHFCATKNHRPAKKTRKTVEKSAHKHTCCAVSRNSPLCIMQGTKSDSLKTGSVSPRTANVRGAWCNPTFCCVYCDLCPRTIAFLSLQILSGQPHGLFPIRRHYNRRFLRCQPLKCEKLRKSADIFILFPNENAPRCAANLEIV